MNLFYKIYNLLNKYFLRKILLIESIAIEILNTNKNIRVNKGTHFLPNFYLFSSKKTSEILLSYFLQVVFDPLFILLDKTIY